MATKYPLQFNKLGFILHDLNPSELAFNIFMRAVELHDWSVYVFFEELSRPPLSSYLSPIYHVGEAYTFDGPLIATTLSTAQKLITFPTPRPKYFFLNDLEWLRYPQKQFDIFASIYQHPELELICRSEQHRILVENCWGKNVSHIIEAYKFYEQPFLDELAQKGNFLYKRREKQYVNSLTMTNAVYE